MRIYFASLDHPKRFAKRLSKLIETPLSTAQRVSARLFGYKHWHELDQVTKSGRHVASKPDDLCSARVVRSRQEFQVDILCHELNCSADDAWSILAELRPTGTMPTSGHNNMVDDLFPINWIPSEDGFINFDDVPADFRMAVGGPDANELLEKMRAAVPSLNDYLGTSGLRVFTARTTTPPSDIQPGKPFVAIAFRLLPIIEETILTRVEIDFIGELNYCSSKATDEEISWIARGIVAYLCQDILHSASATLDLTISGAVDGVDILLTGSVRRDGVLRLHQVLVQMLEDEASDFEADIGWLPLSLIRDAVTIELNHEEQQRSIIRMGSFIEDLIDVEAELFHEAARMLASRAATAGFSALAESLRSDSLAALKERADFLSAVRNAQRECLVDDAIGFYLHHYLICKDAALLHDSDLLVEGGLDELRAHFGEVLITAARNLIASDMASFYQSEGLERAVVMAELGREALETLLDDTR